MDLDDMPADAVVERLGLSPHPEGGWFRETWRSAVTHDGRATGTAILFLLTAGERSHWHRVDAAEIWHHHAGSPLELSTWREGDEAVTRRVAGTDLDAGEAPQLVVEPMQWQAARSLGRWTLVGCTVSPGFEFDGFELAPPDWAPPVGSRP